MLNTLSTLLKGSNARSTERVRDHFALDLIEQKIREAQQSLQSAKNTLASLIQSERTETRQIRVITGRIDALSSQTKDALDAGKEDLAEQAAHSIAAMENELAGRRTTVEQISHRIARLRQSVETNNRRIIDLRQGAINAKVARREQSTQRDLNTTLAGQSSIAEAEALIARVVGEDDPLEQAEILNDIDAALDHTSIGERMAAKGFGTSTLVTAKDVIARLTPKPA